MKKLSIEYLKFTVKYISPKSLTILMGCVSAVLLIALFVLAPQPPEYSYIRTVGGEVISIEIRRGASYYKGDATAIVQFEDGAIEPVSYKTRRVLLVGDVVRVDILEAEGEKPRYRLAADPIPP